jgi:glycosyltransferase involved in cell wall biosynthesis
VAGISNTDESELTIVMPCLNEAETLTTCIQKARKFLVDSKISGEVLIADNGSTDGSQGIAAVHRLSCHTERWQHVPRPVEWN